MQDATPSQDGGYGPPAPQVRRPEPAEAGDGPPQPQPQPQGPARLVDEHGLEVSATESQPLGPAEAEQPSWLPTGLALLGFAIIAWTLVRNIRKRAAAGNAMERPPADRLAQVREQSEARAAVEGFMSDAVELTQRLAAQLDAKAERVEQLLDRVEGRLAELEAREVGRGEATRSAPAPAAGDERPHPRLVREASHEPNGSASGLDPLHRQVYGLADEGLDVLEIARRLDQPRGQIELILALRRA